jgi:pyridoxal phosphate enzyme (YggS family)
MSTIIEERIAQTRERIAAAARRAGRAPSDVLMVAVTKTHGIEVVQAAYEAGLRQFGENRVEEAQTKIVAARHLLPEPLTWHMIGHIQSRKASDVPPLFPWVHSVDRLKVARKLSESALAVDTTVDVLIEINLSGEESKEGYALHHWPDSRQGENGLFQEIEEIAGLPGLRIQGLMTMPPWTPDPELARPVFRRLAMLRDALRNHFPTLAWPHLSIGMSGDFEVAVEEGATIIRLGTVLFGERDRA